MRGLYEESSLINKIIPVEETMGAISRVDCMRTTCGSYRDSRCGIAES